MKAELKTFNLSPRGTFDLISKQSYDRFNIWNISSTYSKMENSIFTAEKLSLLKTVLCHYERFKCWIGHKFAQKWAQTCSRGSNRRPKIQLSSPGLCMNLKSSVYAAFHPKPRKSPMPSNSKIYALFHSLPCRPQGPTFYNAFLCQKVQRINWSCPFLENVWGKTQKSVFGNKSHLRGLNSK